MQISDYILFYYNCALFLFDLNHSRGYTQYGPIKNGRIKNQGSDFERK